ncbi:hypothetical protein PC121_g6580 [Phytophthora cactorum]|nr:hypothetical protein PC120_g4063 [Phytophthora cactorum]KAG3081089.1 hypothetical protein PC121_g6580 [Phytophthora cactorum]KAG4060628.1 hypothetical protein PC123_g4475 [Phytophthora cactorum]
MAATGKGSAFSMLAETAEEFIQLECARRRNQASLKQRSSQFHVSAHKSRLKEKLAQVRRHEFLLRTDNKAALVEIIDHMRELGNDGEEAGDASKASQRNGPSPLERDRFRSWAADVEQLLFEFEPSEIHDNDPLARILERLQFLQDGHVCLAEVAMDARALLERWDREGVFDSESSSEDEDDDDDDDEREDFQNNRGLLPPDPVKENLRHLERSYAYQSVRQRAAAGIIKRNVLIWVRSKDSFCERVAEIEIFGRTTEALLKELRLTTSALSGANLTGNTDIFALGRCDPKSRYGASIAFKDLLQFSKHMALFPVDQALRTVEDVTRRRYLFDSRCALKIQALWRRVGETVRARRLRRAVEELRLRREKEAQATREASKEAKKRKASEAGRRKVTKALKRSSTKRSSLISSAVSKFTSASTAQSDENPTELPKEVTQESAVDTTEKRKPHSPPVPPIDTSNHRASTRGNTLQDKQVSPTSTPRRRQRASQFMAAGNNDSDDDTTDVEAAWKSFMDTVAVGLPEEEVPNETKGTTAPEGEPASDPTRSDPLSSMKDAWESWSDDGIEAANNEKVEMDDELSPMPGTPLTPMTPRIKIVVSVNKSSVSEAAARPLPRREYTTPKRNQTRPHTNPSNPVIRAPSSLPYDATLQDHTGPYTGAGQLSLMAPFIDADRRQKSQISVVPERKHLYELDFNTERMDASFFHVIQALGMLHESEEQHLQSRQKTPEKVTEAVEVPGARSRRTTVARLRSITGDEEQTNRVRNLLGRKNQEATQFNDQQSSSGRSSPRGGKSNQPGYFIYGAQGMKARREVVLRKGSRVYSPLSAPPEEETTSSVDPGSKEIKVWHRSTITAIPETVGVPHPPVDRFRSRHKRRMKGPQRNAITTDTSDQVQTINSSAKKSSKRTEKRNELPLLLRQSRAAARRRKVDEPMPEDSEDRNESPAPDANKQMWKRGGELPELALAQIRDRVGYKPRSSHPKRMSIIAGRAPPVQGVQIDDNSATVLNALDELPETFSSVDEEGGQDIESDNSNADEDGYSSDEAEGDEESPRSDEVDQSHDNGLQRVDSVLHANGNELSEEFQQLHLASRNRELNRHRSLLAHLQDEEDAAADDTRRHSKDVGPQHQQKRGWAQQRIERRSVKLVGEESDVATSADVEVSVWHYESSDSDAYIRTRHRLRVKTRDAKADPCEELSEDDEDEDGDEQDHDVRIRLGMTQQERDAAFQKLLMQYLGLLQCAPAEVARRLQVS